MVNTGKPIKKSVTTRIKQPQSGFINKAQLKFGKVFYPLLALVLMGIVGAAGFYIYQQNNSGAGKVYCRGQFDSPPCVTSVKVSYKNSIKGQYSTKLGQFGLYCGKVTVKYTAKTYAKNNDIKEVYLARLGEAPHIDDRTGIKFKLEKKGVQSVWKLTHTQEDVCASEKNTNTGMFIRNVSNHSYMESVGIFKPGQNHFISQSLPSSKTVRLK